MSECCPDGACEICVCCDRGHCDHDSPIEGVVISHPIPPNGPVFGFDPASTEIFVTSGFYVGEVGLEPGGEGWTKVGYTTEEGIKFKDDGLV